MKRIIFFILMLFQIIIFTSCNNETDAFKNINSEGTLAKGNTKDISNMDLNSKAKLLDKSGGLNSIEIIAESGNSISGADKEKVIKKLDEELGTLFDSINGLEDK
jgi:hypothetical protein